MKHMPQYLLNLAILLGLPLRAASTVHYVDINSTNATPPYTDWPTAATNIQLAVDAAVAGDEIVVTNGRYATGGRNRNTVQVDKPVSVRSVNGPNFTSIQGGFLQGRCVSLSNGASLSGFTLIGGRSTGSGGGAYGGTLNNCTLSHNSANIYGGGAYLCTLNNCTLSGNSVAASNGATVAGGGAANCTLNNCTLAGNSAIPHSYSQCVLWCETGGIPFCCRTTVVQSSAYGGGAYSCTLNNCIVYFNTDNTDGGNYYSSFLNHCCTTPLPSYGPGNITNDPLLLDESGWTDLRLQSNSPCINAGLNAYAPAGPDLDGNPRTVGGTVDIGAYEFQSPDSKISYAWLQQFGLPINNTTDSADPDGDGVENYHEWLANSDPTDPYSFPPLLTLIPYGPNVILTWTTNAVGFTVQSTTNLSLPVLWNTNSPGPVVIGNQNVVINPIAGPLQFYRLVH